MLLDPLDVDAQSAISSFGWSHSDTKCWCDCDYMWKLELGSLEGERLNRKPTVQTGLSFACYFISKHTHISNKNK